MIANQISAGGIEGILFDMGGTLRTRVPDETIRRNARQEFLALLGKSGEPEAWFEELNRRYEAYSEWAQARLIESPEEEIWTRWMLPEFPSEKIVPIAQQLTLVWRERVGRAVVRPDAVETIAELSRRGYRLGLISNTISAVDVPRSLEKYGLAQYFQIVILSSTSGRRKPDPEIFWRATRAMQVEPARCAYIGNRLSRDVVGSHRAGFSKAILIRASNFPRDENRNPIDQPEAVIDNLSELLNIFAPRTL